MRAVFRIERIARHIVVVQNFDLPDGPAPGSALVYECEQLVGELLVWIRDGRLIGLEQAWYTDDPPQSWPPPEMVRIS